MLDKAEFDLILQLGSSSTVKLLRHSIDTTKKATKRKKGLGVIVVSAQKKNAEVESVLHFDEIFLIGELICGLWKNRVNINVNIVGGK